MAVFAATVLAACIGPDEGRAPPVVIEPGDVPPILAERHLGGSPCVLGVADATARVVDAQGGAIVVFTTSRDPSDLRARVRLAAKINGPGAHGGLGHDGAHGTHDGHGLQLWRLPAVKTATDDVPGGAELHLTAVDAKEVNDVRADLRERVGEVEGTPCD